MTSDSWLAVFTSVDLAACSGSTFEFNSIIITVQFKVTLRCVLVCDWSARQSITSIQSTTSTRDRTGHTQRSRHAKRIIWNCLGLSRVAFECRETPQIFHCKSKLPEPRPERQSRVGISQGNGIDQHEPFEECKCSPLIPYAPSQTIA
jgi:hypothetical protein